MTDQYNPQAIEPKWQQKWENDKLYRATVDWDRPKHYALTMLPYPSGDLHIGHWFAMTPSDARARWMRMRGFNVMFPMGFDAFGLPAENAAVQRNIHPARWTTANIKRMREQMRKMGTMFDWEREAVSCDPSYYKWTEWFFKQFFDHDLAYRGEALVNWSPTLQTVLANEQVIDGKDERTGQPVIQKMMTQWFFRYTRYADEMLDFSHIDWPEPIKIMQTNWIGRSEGARVIFKTEQGDPIEIYTTRPDTLWGATFMVLAPEHPLVATITTAEQKAAVGAYIEQAAAATEIERTAEGRDKTGVFTGGYAINPVNGERIPVWIADYVMITYGTGAIMAVPAHDERDFAFARKFGLEIRPVIQPEGETFDGATMTEAYPGAGYMINSDLFNGTYASEDKGRKNPAINAVIDWLEEAGVGREAINYRLRDWLISRQRYWGSPIPVIHRADGKIESVRDDQLPVLLPDDVEFMPTGRSPLTYHEPFLNTVDSDGNPARRETDTMDTFMCSSWYWYRYLNPHFSSGAFDPEEAAYWLPVDTYTGGAEHATMHLLYSRWFAKAMRDLGMFDETIEMMQAHGRDPEEMTWGEPMLQLRNQGQVLGAERMGDIIFIKASWTSKSGHKSSVSVHFPGDPNDIPTQIVNQIEVFNSTSVNEVLAHAEPGDIVGELVKRTELTLHVRDIRNVGIEPHRLTLSHNATINIHDIPGENNVNQLKHHLEIQRMSKSKGNVVNPDELVAQYGADTVRAYLMFAFDWEKGGPWDPDGIKGPVRWLNEVWDIIAAGAPAGDGSADRDIERKLHQTILKVSSGLEKFSFNTAIAGLMEFKNTLVAAIKAGGVSADAWRDAMHVYLRLMAPFTPHMAEELWSGLGFGYSIHQQDWPEYDAAKAAEDALTLVVMINGKVRDKVTVPVDVTEEDAKAAALGTEGAQKALNGKQPKRVIYIAARTGQEPKVNVVV
ncbi:MAG: leucine--tRNA ligase [Anaerolineaceae bacterium]|nr:leucine--tRNA ligase [Anaerolineaceae bacterium]